MHQVKNKDELIKIIQDGKIPLETIDTSLITDMSYLFKSVNKINGSIATWNTSSVTNMFSMFEYSTIQPDISKWNANERIINNSLLIVNEDKR